MGGARGPALAVPRSRGAPPSWCPALVVREANQVTAEPGRGPTVPRLLRSLVREANQATAEPGRGPTVPRLLRSLVRGRTKRRRSLDAGLPFRDSSARWFGRRTKRRRSLDAGLPFRDSSARWFGRRTKRRRRGGGRSRARATGQARVKADPASSASWERANGRPIEGGAGRMRRCGTSAPTSGRHELEQASACAMSHLPAERRTPSSGGSSEASFDVSTSRASVPGAPPSGSS